MAPINLLLVRIQRLKEVPDGFINDVEKAQSEIFSNLLKKLDALEIGEGGKVKMSNRNFSLIRDLGEDFEAIIAGPGTKYYKAVSSFVKEFSAQKDINKKYFEKFFDFKNQPEYEALAKSSQENAIDVLANSAVTENVTTFKSILQNAIATEDNYTKLVGNIKTEILGNDQIDGGMIRYAKQEAHDLYAISDRQYVGKISDDLGIEFFEFGGGVIASTRPFCHERNGHIFHRKEIEAWGAGKVTIGMKWPKGGKWAGRSASTDSTTIMTLLGGYHCEHVLAPVAIQYVPEEVIQRAISQGFYKK